jgi:hypothetical protein
MHLPAASSSLPDEVLIAKCPYSTDYDALIEPPEPRCPAASKQDESTQQSTASQLTHVVLGLSDESACQVSGLSLDLTPPSELLNQPMVARS